MVSRSLALAVLIWSLCPTLSMAAASADQPNVVIIIADDMGYGDLGVHGNRVIRTPHLDRLAAEAMEFTNFHVSPVCAPTRSALLTGRYNYRTGVTDTFQGRAMMHPNETTLAEYLSAAGYINGIFGKWHLGDCYPMRPIDQGFQQSLIHRGGGIGQPSDPPGGSSYFDPILFREGKPEKQHGYVSDCITDAAIQFVEQNQKRPFFLYLAFNAPHVPLQVPDSYQAMYQNVDWPRDAPPTQTTDKLDPGTVSRVYRMVTNMDDNVGRLLQSLDKLKLADNTIVIFLTDNGPQQPRFNSHLRGLKGTVYEGGIRVPFFVRWPGRIKSGKTDRLAAHIDVVPTLLAACHVPPTVNSHFDGQSLWPLCGGTSIELPDRMIFLQWHRGNAPEPYRGFAAITQSWKLLRADHGRSETKINPGEFELYKVDTDRGETHDVASDHPQIVARLRNEYDLWLKDVSNPRGFDPVRIVLGSDHENPLTLTRQDWRRTEATAKGDSIGQWFVDFAEQGMYQFHVRFQPAVTGPVDLTINDQHWQADSPPSGETEIGPIQLPAGRATIAASCKSATPPAGAFQITVKRLPK